MAIEKQISIRPQTKNINLFETTNVFVHSVGRPTFVINIIVVKDVFKKLFT